MGMRSTVELAVRTFSEEAKKKVLAIDLDEYNLLDWEEKGPMLYMDYNNVAAGQNDFEDLMNRISEALNGEGMAYLIEYVEEDIPYATTYFYQGNGVKSKDFKSDPDGDLSDMRDEMGEDADIRDVLEAAREKRYNSYIPTAEWARGKKFTPEERELLEKYPW